MTARSSETNHLSATMTKEDLIIEQNKTIIKQLKMLVTILGKKELKPNVSESGKGKYADKILNKYKTK